MIYDVAIFGGGVVGASIFNKVCRCGKSAILLELNDIASGESKANSGIVHAGFDAMPNTNKARLNVLGSNLYPDICSRLNVPYKQIGAYVLGSDIKVVEDLYNRGITNGLACEDLKIISGNKLKKVLPNLNENITCALYAKKSAVVNPYLFTICLAEEGVVNGGECKTFFKTTKITFNGKYFEIYGNKEILKARKIVNASGFGYNNIAKLLGTEKYQINFRRGEYYVLDNNQKTITPSTLFPLPTKHSKGVLITPTIDGNYLVGPTSTESENITKTTNSGLKEIKEKSLSIINNVNLKTAIRVFSGIRPVVGDDFIIEKSKINSKVINIAGICSPGLSSAPAIALDVIKLLGIKDAIVNTNTIEPYILAKSLPKAKYNALVKENPTYGNIICKCEMITEGDIISALHRPIPVITIDGIKRRVRAGMGRCQGGFCMAKVAKIIARENNIPMSKVLKEYPKSEIMKENIK